MKKATNFFTVLMLTVLCGNAQPNGGFEQWHNEFNYETPDGWQTFNALAFANPPSPLSAFKVSGIDKHSGNYALKLKSIPIYINALTDLIGDTAGGIFTGTVIYSPFVLKYGFPYTSRPEKMQFWAKYFPVGNDTAGAIILLSKWNGVKTDTVALYFFTIPSTSNYASFQESITYYSDQMPDSATIAFYTSSRKENARVNSTLYIDDVTLTGWVGIENHTLAQAQVKVFPNPATGNITIQTGLKEAENIQIRDISGREINNVKLTNGVVSIDTKPFPEGVYFYEIRDRKKQFLKTGKFNVVK
jgi:hypothetical protein